MAIFEGNKKSNKDSEKNYSFYTESLCTINQNRMGTIKCGFWNFKFIITPEEFGVFTKECIGDNITFHLTTAESEEHKYKEIIKAYTKYYKERLTASNQATDYIESTVYKLNFITKEIGFFMRNESIRIYDKGFNYGFLDHKFEYLNLMYQKSVSVDKEDEKGEYFIYEDINLYQPHIYTIYEKIIKNIKSYTKPLRVESIEGNKITSSLSGIRISKKASRDIEKSWYFQKTGMKMLSWKRKKTVHNNV